MHYEDAKAPDKCVGSGTPAIYRTWQEAVKVYLELIQPGTKYILTVIESTTGST